MNQEMLEKFIKLGKKRGLSAVGLSQLLTQPPHNLCAAESSIVYYEFNRRYPAPQVSLSAPVPKPPVKKSLAPELPTVDAGSNYQPSILNRSAVKTYALGVSEKHRAGKFKRVSPAFILGVEAELENFIRGLDKGDEALDTLTLSFINAKRALPKVEELLNRAVRRIIIRRVHSHPSKGQTLR